MYIQWTQDIYSVVITQCNDNLIHLFHNSTVCVINSRVSGQCLYTMCYQLTNYKACSNMSLYCKTYVHICSSFDDSTFGCFESQL